LNICLIYYLVVLVGSPLFAMQENTEDAKRPGRLPQASMQLWEQEPPRISPQALSPRIQIEKEAIGVDQPVLTIERETAPNRQKLQLSPCEKLYKRAGKDPKKKMKHTKEKKNHPKKKKCEHPFKKAKSNRSITLTSHVEIPLQRTKSSRAIPGKPSENNSNGRPLFLEQDLNRKDWVKKSINAPNEASLEAREARVKSREDTVLRREDSALFREQLLIKEELFPYLPCSKIIERDFSLSEEDELQPRPPTPRPSGQNRNPAFTFSEGFMPPTQNGYPEGKNYKRTAPSKTRNVCAQLISSQPPQSQKTRHNHERKENQLEATFGDDLLIEQSILRDELWKQEFVSEFSEIKKLEDELERTKEPSKNEAQKRKRKFQKKKKEFNSKKENFENKFPLLKSVKKEYKAPEFGIP